MATKEKSKQDGQLKDQEVIDWRQKIEEEYTYCMISTLNQMVNYLPMLLFDFRQPKMYVTLKDSELNKTFDQNLKETCLNFNGSCQSNRFAMPEEDIRIGDLNDVSNIQSTLSQKSKGKKVLWNITGGQRPFVMAVFELLKATERKDDLVFYLEGNSGEPIFWETKNNRLEKVPPNIHGFESYQIKNDQSWLTIPIALQLMGIEVHEYNTFSANPVLDSITAKYEKKENDMFRRRLLSLNKRFTSKTKGLEKKVKPETPEDKKLYFIEVEYVYNDGANERTSSVRFYNGKIWNCPDAQKREYLLKDQDEAYLNQEEYDFLTKSYAKRSFPFGHLLEEMFAQKLWKLLNGSIADMAVNLKLFSPKESINEQIDEIDIAILTKTGQLVVFEVKSGDMSGDVAKSTKYTTYAIAGVYGKPILLTALLKYQFDYEEKLASDWAYGSSAAAKRAARRAQLPIIALDGNESGDFKAAIKNLLHL